MTQTHETVSTPRRPTINDVARVAGVTKGTVSRFLNGKNWIAPATGDAIRDAVAELGYVPNGLARNLAKERTDCVALVFSDPTRMLSANAIFAGVVETTTRELASRGVSAVLMFADSADLKLRVLSYVQARHVDGVILLSASAGDSLATDLLETGVPLVAGGPLGRDTALPVPFVGVDDAKGSRQAIDHLVDVGRQRIGIISGPLTNVGTITRHQSAVDQLRSAGRTDIPHVAATDFSAEAGYHATRQILEQNPGLDALYVASDVLAEGTLRFLRESGRRVPASVAVVGFDNASNAATLDPPLTTISVTAQPHSPATLILDIIDGRNPQSVLVPTELIKRAST